MVKMRTCRSSLIILLAFLSRVSAERPVRVIATIPNESFLARNTEQGLIEPKQSNDDGDTRVMKDVEVTGFITKNGDIFEVSESRGIGSIESRQEPEPGMTMCRYGTIVVYSDKDCNTFFTLSQNLGGPVKTPNKEEESDVEEADEKPLKKKKKRKTKGSRRKPNKNKVQKRKKNKKNNKRKNKVRRKALKQRGNKNRRRTNLNKKRRKNLKNKQRNQRRGNKKNVKRRRINHSEERSAPKQFAILYERH